MDQGVECLDKIHLAYSREEEEENGEHKVCREEAFGTSMGRLEEVPSEEEDGEGEEGVCRAMASRHHQEVSQDPRDAKGDQSCNY